MRYSEARAIARARFEQAARENPPRCSQDGFVTFKMFPDDDRHCCMVQLMPGRAPTIVPPAAARKILEHRPTCVGVHYVLVEDIDTPIRTMEHVHDLLTLIQEYTPAWIEPAVDYATMRGAVKHRRWYIMRGMQPPRDDYTPY